MTRHRWTARAECRDCGAQVGTVPLCSTCPTPGARLADPFAGFRSIRNPIPPDALPVPRGLRSALLGDPPRPVDTWPALQRLWRAS